MKNKNICIFGGKFNPFHDGHFQAIKKVLELENIDEVWIMPMWLDKNQAVNLSWEHRIEIINLFIKSNAKIKVNKTEFNQGKWICTFETLKILKRKYLNNSFSLLIGEDQWLNFSQWIENKKIRSEHLILIASRCLNLEKTNSKGADFLFLENKSIDISSSNIAKGKYTNLSLKVINYINHNSLFYKYRLNLYVDSKRATHSTNTAELAVSIAMKNKIDLNKAFFAAVYHDYFKNIVASSNFELLVKKYLNNNVQNIPLPAIHGPIAANYIKEKWFVTDKEIINAIANHTIPTLKMTTFEKMIYCCDKLSKERKNIEHKLYLPILEDDINKCFAEILYHSIIYLITKKRLNNNYYIDLARAYFKHKRLDEITNLLNKTKKLNI